MRLFLLLLSLPILGFSQEETYQYKCVFISQCSGEILANKTFAIWNENDTSSNRPVQIFDTSDTLINLKKNGNYQVSLLAFTGETFQVSPTDESQSVDTFFLSKLNSTAFISDPPQVYYTFCGEQANGFIKDYYSNGNLKAQGLFKDGIAVDSVKRYFSTGELEAIEIRANRSFEFLSYYPSGNLRTHKQSKDAFERSYFENGQLELEKSWKKGNHKMMFFDSTGVLKRKETEQNATVYSAKGKPLEKIKRKRDAKNGRFTFDWERFDETGKTIQKVGFSGRLFNHETYPYALSDIQNQNFDYIYFYENGKLMTKLLFEEELTRNGMKKKIKFTKLENDTWIEKGEYYPSELPALLKKIN